MTYVVLIGQRSAGKGEFSKYVQQVFGWEVLVFSAALQEIGLEERIVTQNELDEDLKAAQSKIGTELRTNPDYGVHVYIGRMVAKIKDDMHYLLDGLRDPRELELLNTELSSVTTIGIFADYDIRCQRSIDCGSARNAKHFAELEAKVSELPINELLKNADYKIINNGSLAEYYREIDKVLSDLL